jgi:hypothetical protein
MNSNTIAPRLLAPVVESSIEGVIQLVDELNCLFRGLAAQGIMVTLDSVVPVNDSCGGACIEAPRLVVGFYQKLGETERPEYNATGEEMILRYN